MGARGRVPGGGNLDDARGGPEVLGVPGGGNLNVTRGGPGGLGGGNCGRGKGVGGGLNIKQHKKIFSKTDLNTQIRCRCHSYQATSSKKTNARSSGNSGNTRDSNKIGRSNSVSARAPSL